MKSKYLNVFSAILAFGLMIALSGGVAFGQGKGGGKGNKGGGGGKPEKQGNGNGGGGGNGMGRGSGGGRHGGFLQQRQEQPRFERPQPVERQQRIQVYQNPNAGRPQYRQERDYSADWKQQRKAQKQEFKQERREARQPQYQARPQIIVPRYENRQANRGNRRSWEGLPPGQYRKQANMERRDDRKAAKSYEKDLKRQAKIYRDDDRREYQQRVQYVQNAPVFWQQFTQTQSRQYYDRNRYYENDRSRYIYDGRNDNNYDYNNNYYNDGYDGYDSGVSWKQQLLSTVLTQFLGGGFGGLGNAYDENYGYGYDQQQYGYNSPNYYNAQYGGYQGQQGYSDYNYGGYDDNGYNNYDPNSFINAIPYAGLIDQYSGGFATDMIRQSLGMGYDEGYYAGQYARTNGTADDYYYDPYSYPNGSYDAGSISLAERRRILSEGYELGYQDALYGRNQNDYDPQSEGDVDLVSLLLSSVLKMV